MALAQLLPPSASMRGDIAWEDEAQSPTDLAQRRGTEIGIIFQDPSTALTPWLSIGEQLAEGPRALLGLSKKSAQQRSIDLLNAVGLKQPEQCLKRYPHQFSGGQRQRIVIAQALACDPKLLLCDEPTTALDVTIQAQILSLLDNLRRQRRCGLLFVSHDLSVIGAICEKIHVMYGGRMLESGPTHEILERPQHPYTQALQAAAPSTKADVSLPLPTVDPALLADLEQESPTSTPSTAPEGLA
jgi:ABC-type dipeptide/oligopeptide/nickel transport system ATPase component